MIPMIQQNARDLEQELAWFARLLDLRFKLYFGEGTEYPDIFETTPPDLGVSESAYAGFVRHYKLSFVERAAIVLSLTPLIRPQLLDIFHTKNKTFDRKFTEFGGIRDTNGEFVPNGRDEPMLKGSLRLSEEYFGLFTTGHARRPDLSADFPARHIETQLDWADLVLHPGTLRQVREIEVWIRHGETLMNEWDMAAKLRPGYRALFYGPPGTGKTMTACLLGKSTGREVYNVDLSLVVSKYIGATEKNLAHVFDQAQHKGWILFFDEADALFGKRSETKMLT